MLIAWMLYAIALTTIVAGCALSLDRVAEIWSTARRAIWLVALVISVLVPTALAFRPASEVAVARMTASPTREPEQMSVQAFTGHVALSDVKATRKFSLNALQRRYVLPPFWNRIAAAGWIAASVVLAGLLFRGAIALWRGQSRWNRSIVDGHSVLVTADVGPAVIGLLRPRIVLPSWALALGEHERRLMLEHEAQHVHARDPIVIAVAAWALALFPWNPAVWFLVKRLRLAIEIDCDRRVLASRASTVRDYGMLLLAVGSRSPNALQFGASLAEPRRFLEQRILAMTASRASRPLIASTPFVAIACLGAIAVAQTPRPPSTLLTTPATPPRIAATVDTSPMREPPALTEVPKPRAQRQPVQLPRRVEGAPNAVEVPRIEIAPTAASEPLPIDVIRRWIESRHPNILAGDARVNAVIIVVDANNQYLASATDSIADSGRVGDWPNFRVMDPANRLPTTSPPQPVIYVDGVAVENPDRLKAKPVLIVDGVRLENIEQLDSIAIKSVEVLKGAGAVANYGADAANGVIVVTSKPRTTVDLSRFGIDAQSVSEMTEFRLRPGVVGPNRLYITVLQIKKR